MMNAITRFLVLAVAALVVAPAASALDAREILACRDAEAGKVVLNYRDTPLRAVMAGLERQRRGINLRLRAPSPAEERELADTRVDADIAGVSWDTALRYLAERTRLDVDRRQEADGLIYLEKPARFSDTFNGVPLGVAVREIAKRGDANVIFSPRVDASKPVRLSFTDVPWRDALASILAAHGCALEEDANGKILRVVSVAEVATKVETRLRPLRYARPDAPVAPEGFEIDPLGLRERSEGVAVDAQATTLVSLLERVKSPAGSVGYEPRTNSLVLADTRGKIEEMLRLVDGLDVPPEQVLLEMRVVTVDCASASYPEIRWDEDSVWRGENGDGLRGPFGRTGSMSREALFALEMAARVDPAVRIVQAPEMLVLDGEEAAVFVGDLRSRATRRGQEPSAVGALVGTHMAVVPSVCRGTDRVIVEMFPLQTGDTLVDRTGWGGKRLDLPARTNVKAVRTKAMLRSSETAVFAGFIDDVDAGGEIKPASSRQSPDGKRAWTCGGREKTRRNTLILVTATIVPSGCGEDGATEAEIAKAREALAAAY